MESTRTCLECLRYLNDLKDFFKEVTQNTGVYCTLPVLKTPATEKKL